MAEHEGLSWEYRIESDPPAGETLAALGADRWELIGIDNRDGRYLFKRPMLSFRSRVTLAQRTRVFGLRARQREAEA